MRAQLNNGARDETAHSRCYSDNRESRDGGGESKLREGEVKNEIRKGGYK